MIRSLFICCFAALLVSADGCKPRSNAIESTPSEVYVPASSTVAFDITPVQAGNTAHWLATYVSQGKTAKFRIELGPAKELQTKDSDDIRIPIKSGAGKFVAEAGSDSSVLLADLKKALEAKKFPTKVKRVPSLPFEFVNLGESQSQSSDGDGFSNKPAGNWTVMKIFLGAGEQEGEVFLNLNPKLGKGQFSIKDADYGDDVLRELAKVI